MAEVIETMTLMSGVRLSRTADAVHVKFDQRHRVLSSAVLNGGICRADGFLNIRVGKHNTSPLEDPQLTLQRISDQFYRGDITVGMMTAASMDSLRALSAVIENESIAVVVTTGLANARRAGDPAEYRSLEDEPLERGTINLAIITSARVADEAMVEMIAVATEAKVAALHDLNIKSSISNQLATGTGTDSIAVFSGEGRQSVRYAGKHTVLGEKLALMVMQVIQSSVNYKTGSDACD